MVNDNQEIVAKDFVRRGESEFARRNPRASRDGCCGRGREI
jgi:hypothetical protein